MLVRIVIGLLVVLAIVVAVRRMRAHVTAARRPRPLAASTARCARCAVYFPRSEAVVVEGRTYCSREHAERERA